MDDLDLQALDLAAVRCLLPAWLASTVLGCQDDVQRAVADVVDAASDADLTAAMSAMSKLGTEYRLYPADPLTRRVSRAYTAALLAPGSSLAGIEHLTAAAAAGPVLLVGNHRSYVDTQLTDCLLARHDAALADRLVTIAGPKVYATTFRRFASLGLSTLKTAQSSQLATNDAGLSPRQVARIALQTVRHAHELMAAGRPVLLYPEGTRSRTGRLGDFLRAAERYARLDGLAVVPVALTGSERVFPVDALHLSPALVRLRFGAPLSVDDLPTGDRPRGQVLDRTHAALAAMLATMLEDATGTAVDGGGDGGG